MVGGTTIDRQCASGLMAIATAAKQVMVDGQTVAVGGGLESISLVQNQNMNLFRMQDPGLIAMVPSIYMTMLETAEVVSRRYGISRDAQDEYALQSQQRTAQAQAEGRFDAEIVPMTTTMQVVDKATGQASAHELTLSKDEGNRADTTLEGLLGPREKDLRDWDRKGEMPADFVDQLREAGLFSFVIPEEHGGLGFGSKAYSRALQAVASYDASVAVTVGAHSSMRPSSWASAVQFIGSIATWARNGYE